MCIVINRSTSNHCHMPQPCGESRILGDSTLKARNVLCAAATSSSGKKINLGSIMVQPCSPRLYSILPLHRYWTNVCSNETCSWLHHRRRLAWANEVWLATGSVIGGMCSEWVYGPTSTIPIRPRRVVEDVAVKHPHARPCRRMDNKGRRTVLRSGTLNVSFHAIGCIGLALVVSTWKKNPCRWNGCYELDLVA